MASFLKKLFGISDFNSNIENEPSNLNYESEEYNSLEPKRRESVKVPNLQNAKEYRVTEWFVQNGDIVQKGMIICHLESDCFEMEFESFVNGKIISICEISKILNIGDELFTIEHI